MPERISAYWGEAARMLPLREQRMKLVASNLANIDTPGYRARDIDFATALHQAGQTSGPLTATDTQHFRQGNYENLSAYVYRVNSKPNLDGNTVDPDTERAAYGRAALEYRASLNFIENKAHLLTTAITGQ